MNLEQRMKEQLAYLDQKGGLRYLRYQPQLIDFCSNDYLGLARSNLLKQRVAEGYAALSQSGATGSRLLSGEHAIMQALEQQLAAFHLSDTALLFNSGYDANLSLFSAIPRKGDIIFYDNLVHASIHDGMRMGKAEAIAFRHNDTDNLEELLKKYQSKASSIFVAAESVYSMEGDTAPLYRLVELCQKYNAYLILDEAHATGICGKRGEGLAVELGLEQDIFARLHCFGKAIGGHGAAVLGSALLRNYLINYARPLIFSTALPLHSVVHIAEAYRLLEAEGEAWVYALQEHIHYFRQLIQDKAPHLPLLPSTSPIQGILQAGNEAAVALSQKAMQAGFDVRPIRFPTVPRGSERLRICLHLFNSREEIRALVSVF